MAAYLLMMKETGARCGEALQLKWADVDSVNGTVWITPEKGSNPRIVRISAKLLSMIHALPKNERVYSYKNQYYARKTFTRQRKRIARKVDNPRLLLIHFHTLRHWKATMEYAKTKDILHVMQLLGHKDIKTTLKYTQLIGFSSDEYMCRVAKTVEEATQLVEAGYEYVTELEGVKLFRKRK
jgi:integrase